MICLLLCYIIFIKMDCGGKNWNHGIWFGLAGVIFGITFDVLFIVQTIIFLQSI